MSELNLTTAKPVSATASAVNWATNCARIRFQA